MIRLQNFSYSVGDRTLFRDVTTLFQPNEKYALIGRNGIGKSTLLSLIADTEKPRSGVTHAKNFSVGYLPQEVVLRSSKTVQEEVLSVCTWFDTWYAIKQAEIQGFSEQKIANLHIELAEFSYWQDERQAEIILQGLGFSLSDQHKPVSQFSTGWQMRVVLAKLLMQQADFYLFDEPTNHLDLTSRRWLAQFLKEMSSGYILISHDSYFLNETCDVICEIDFETITQHRGSLSEYRKHKQEELERLEQEVQTLEKQKEEMKKTISRFAAKASKASMAKSMHKKLKKLEEQTPEIKRSSTKTVALKFPGFSPSGKIACTVSRLSKSYGEKVLFSNVSFDVNRGARLALVAPNGTGKTTLMHCMTGQVIPDSGVVSFGHNVEYALFKQNQAQTLNLENTILDEVESVADAQLRPHARAILGALMFAGDDVFKKIKVLSGGEKNRAAFAKLLVQQANTLFLDEPTNHLDMYAQEALLSALKQYPGTIIFVSHDHDFVQGLATELFVYSNGAWVFYPGSYDEWCAFQEAAALKEPRRETLVEKDKPKKPTSKDEYSLKKQLQSLERKMTQLEEQKLKVEQQLEQFDYNSQEYSEAALKHKAILAQLESVHQEWESLYTALEL